MMAVETFPVVHIHEVSQAVEQSGVAFEMGADGIYLIDHNNWPVEKLIDSFNEVSTLYPGKFVGLNFQQHRSAALSLEFLSQAVKSGEIARLPDGLWADDADEEKYAFLRLRAENATLANIRYLGGVAFKYTPSFTSDPKQSAAEAIRLEAFVDVVTTSGRGTGKAPSPEKIQAMKSAIGEKKLAVASGISLENFADYDGNFDQLLVSTSVEVEPYSGIFDPVRLKELIDLTRAS
jgi:hypothetical protein